MIKNKEENNVISLNFLKYENIKTSQWNALRKLINMTGDYLPSLLFHVIPITELQ